MKNLHWNVLACKKQKKKTTSSFIPYFIFFERFILSLLLNNLWYTSMCLIVYERNNASIIEYETLSNMQSKCGFWIIWIGNCVGNCLNGCTEKTVWIAVWIVMQTHLYDLYPFRRNYRNAIHKTFKIVLYLKFPWVNNG